MVNVQRCTAVRGAERTTRSVNSQPAPAMADCRPKRPAATVVVALNSSPSITAVTVPPSHRRPSAYVDADLDGAGVLPEHLEHAEAAAAAEMGDERAARAGHELQREVAVRARVTGDEAERAGAQRPRAALDGESATAGSPAKAATAGSPAFAHLIVATPPAALLACCRRTRREHAPLERREVLERRR